MQTTFMLFEFSNWDTKLFFGVLLYGGIGATRQWRRRLNLESSADDLKKFEIQLFAGLALLWRLILLLILLPFSPVERTTKTWFSVPHPHAMVWDIPQATTPHIEGSWFSLETKNQISVLFKQKVLFAVLFLVSLAVLEQINPKVDPKTALKLSP